MALRTILTVAGVFASTAGATPTIAFPINSQVPPVARVSEPFSYTFSSSTFSSTQSLTYTLSEAPSWLSLDSNTRTLSGTPETSDVGTDTVTGIDVQLTASDDTGSVTLNATLVISKNAAPIVNIPLSAQLADFGSTSAPSTILYHPSTDFTFQFDPETFTDPGDGSSLGFYSVSLGNTPLPSWVKFDGSSLSFSGTTPEYESLIQPPQTFGIQLIASDVEGFAGASISFDIEVGVHLLAFKTTDLTINATVGDDVKFSGLSNNLELDGNALNLSSLASITAQTPSWLSFDNTTFILSGTVPADAVPTNFSVQATDIYGDTDNATIHLEIVTDLFSSQIGPLNVTAGSPFSFDFGSYVRNKSDIEMTLRTPLMTSWISFDTQTFIMSGTVPSSTADSQIGVTLTATSKSTKAMSSQTFDIFVASVDGKLSSSSTSASRSSTPSSTSASLSSNTSSSSTSAHKGLSGAAIAAIVVPITLALIAVLLSLFCCMRRRRAAKRPRSPTKSDISLPIEETSSSVMEIIEIIPTEPPPPLQLDTTGFSTIPEEESSSSWTDERSRGSGATSDNPLRRSQTMSAVSGPSREEFRLSDSMRNRAYSENALSRTDKSKTDKSSRLTQDSAYPAFSSSSGTNSSHRLTRNYSRKGQKRQSGGVKSRDSALRDSTFSSVRPPSTILNLADSNFSFVPLDSFSALSKRTSTQPSESTSSGDRLQYSRSAKRRSKFISGTDRGLGIGHGGRESVASLAGLPSKRRSIGHGQNWESIGMSRDSSTWLTVHSGAAPRDPNRFSDMSSATDSTDVLDADRVAPLYKQGHNIRFVPPSSARVSESSMSSRPVSRRMVGASPFFAGGSVRSSRLSPNKIRTSYEDSPTVPEMAMAKGHVAMGDLPEYDNSRDGLGISYSGAREGTRQLRSYIHNRLTRNKTANSLVSNSTKDSRFESADSLNQSQPNIVLHARSPEPSQPDIYEQYMRNTYSDGSWETQSSHPRDSSGNIVGHGLEEPQVERGNKDLLVPGTALSSHPASNDARIMEGRGKRPFSVDGAIAAQGSMRGIVESNSDYTVYI